MDSSVHSALHPDCHHQVVYSKLKNRMPILCERLFLDYKNSNTQLLNRTIEIFNWQKLLENQNVILC